MPLTPQVTFDPKVDADVQHLAKLFIGLYEFVEGLIDGGFVETPDTVQYRLNSTRQPLEAVREWYERVTD